MPDSSALLTWQSVVDQHLDQSESLTAVQSNNPHVPDVNLPISDVKTYETVSISEISLRMLSELNEPIDLLQFDRAKHSAGTAVGVILRYEQAWRMKGLSIGRLLHSLCLAPGEVTQIAMVDWNRDTDSGAAENIGEQEDASKSALRNRTTHEVTNAVAHELQRGGSSTTSSSVQADGGVGGVVGLFGGSASASTNSSIATSVNWSTGSRNASAESLQRIRESTAQHAANARVRRATLVQEVTESETEQFTTRVIANYNHMYALNMQYYEVLQVYELATYPVYAERCIFLPMQVLRLDEDDLKAFSTQLSRAARAMGNQQLAEAITHFGLTPAQSDSEIEHLRVRAQEAPAEVGSAERMRQEAMERIRLLRVDMERLIEKRHDIAQTNPSDLIKVEKEMLGMQARLAVANEAIAEAQKRLDSRISERDAVLEELEAALAGRAKERGEILREVQEHQLAFSQAIWAQLDPASIQAMFTGFSHQGMSLIETVDPVPVAVTGNYLGFRWRFPDDEKGDEAALAFTKRYVDDHSEPALDTHVLPTGGVFAEAVLGQANAAEKLDLTRFWHWDDKTIPILPTAIKKLRAARHAPRDEAEPGQLDPAVVAIDALPIVPAGPARGLASVVGASLFRDMSGSDVIGDLLQAGQKAAAEGSESAQQIAHENISAYLDHIEKLLPELTNALSSGSLDPSTLGALNNALGDDGVPDPTALISLASKAGLLL